MKEFTVTYSVITAEPGYQNGDTIIDGGLSASEAASLWYSLRREYLQDPENNNSYGEIVMDGLDTEYADEDVVFGSVFWGKCPQIWQLRHMIAEQSRILLGL